MNKNADYKDAAVTLMHGRQKHRISLGETVGSVRIQVELVCGVPSAHQQIIVRGKMIASSVPSDTPAASCNIKPGCTILLLSSSGASVRKSTSVNKGTMAVRRIESEVVSSSSKLVKIEGNVRKTGLGFLDGDKTEVAVARLRRECEQVEEELMRALCSADGLRSEDLDSQDVGANAQWRAERKSVVQKAQTALRSCDDIQRRLDEYVSDEFGELAFRRGKPS